MHPAPRNAGSHTALAHLSALATRRDGRLITPLYAPDPDRATRFGASLDDLTPDHAKSSLDHTTRDALTAAADLDGSAATCSPARW
jgi:glucose-6-phosphate isomerase